MDRNTFRAFMTAASDLPAIGDFYEGGYFAGLISHTANGVPTHALIVSPKAFGEDILQLQSVNSTTGATSPFDGVANTLLMTNSPAADFCTGLTVNGYSDWYVPARYELDIAYFNLKPGTTSNSTSWGINDYSVPKRTTNYTANNPTQTSVAAFQSGGTEAFADSQPQYWSSSENPLNPNQAWRIFFTSGAQISDVNSIKTNSLRLRAFRRLPL
jgi:hypothetical protein